MKLTCTSDNFKKAVFNLERVVSKQNTLVILNNLLFETKNGGLKISATNLEIGATIKIGAKIEKEGSVTVPAKLIGKFVNNLPSGESVFLNLEDQNLKIKSGPYKAAIKTLPADDFPLIPQKSGGFLLSLSGWELKKAVGRVINCAAFNEARQELTGVNLILSDQRLFFAATDSFRLSESRVNLKSENILNQEEFKAFLSKTTSLIIPANTLTELLRIISSEDDSLVKVAIEENQIFFQIDGTEIISRLINGKYPEYQHIIPKEYKTTAIGEKDLIQNLVKMGSVFSPSKSSEISLKIDSDKKKIQIESKSAETGESLSECDLETQGPSQEIIFNSRYLLDGINNISTLRMAVLANSESSPAALKEVDEKSGKTSEEYVYIVMPIKN